MKNIVDCLMTPATPQTTLGMGNIEPLNEPMPIKKRKHKKQHKMKAIKQFLKKKIMIAP